MTSKSKNIINWVLTVIIALIFISSGSGKIIGEANAIKMAESFGISAAAFKIIGFIELIAVLLFIFPRTGILGAFTLIAFMGGAIATHLEHNQPFMPQLIISAFLWIVTVVRFPELLERITGKRQ
jgi:uncharacterized membrane protein YphA (DoxX/SURF4 family)